MAGPYYIPSESGVALGSQLGTYFRLKISQTYDPVANRSSLSIVAQIKCSGNFSPKVVQFQKDNTVSGSAEVRIDGVKVGEIASTSGRTLAGLYSNMNTWVDVGASGSPYTMTATVDHGSAGAKTITVAYGRMYAVNPSQTYYGTCAAYSGSVNISQPRSFTLSISAGTGSTISVAKNGTPLSDGASVDYGDVLTITFAANTGYNLVTHTVNGSTFTSGGTITVTNAVTVVSTAAKKSYTLSISQGSHSTITVKRNGSVLSNGATVYHFDQLQITMTAASGYHLTTNSVSGATQSGGYYVVNNNVTVTTVAVENDHTLHISPGAGTTLTVLKGGVALSDGANVQTSDVLTITASATEGYENPVAKVNGSPVSGTYTVGDTDVDVTSEASLESYTLTITQGENSAVSVKRNGSPVASGSTIYYWDELVITATPAPGYELSTFTVNSEPFVSGGTYTVKGAVAVVTVAEELVGAYLKLVTGWARYAAYIFGNSWNRYVPYIKTTNGWVKY